MRGFRAWFVRLGAALRPGRRDRDLADELNGHLELAIEEQVRAGLPRAEARRRALTDLGGVAATSEYCRERSGISRLEAIARDIRFGLRLIRRHPGFSAIAILTLAVAIGVNTAVYTLVDETLIRPVPYPEPDRLATIARHYSVGTASGDSYSMTGLVWQTLHQQASAIDLAAVGGVNGVNVSAGNETSYVRQQRVSAGFFRVLGIPLKMGREFTADEDRTGGAAVAVLSHAFWMRAFGGAADVVGRDLMLRGEPFTIVGVMPDGFRSNVPADVWTPLRPSTQGEGSGSNYLLAARIKDGHDWPEADQQVQTIGAVIIRDYVHPPPNVHLAIQMAPLQSSMTQTIRTPLLVLWAAVAIVLLIGCVNITGLMLVRGLARTPEIATRVALGGERVNILQQLLAESMVLALCGGAAGIALGYGLTRLIATRLQDVMNVATTPDPHVLAIAAMTSVLTGLFVGLIPAFQASQTDVRSMLIAGGGPTVAGSVRRWPAQALVVTEVALGIVLVVAGGLLIRSFTRYTQLRPGFEAANVITGKLSLQDARYRTGARVNDLFTRSLDRMRRIPGVEHAAIALTLPYERAMNQGWRFEGDDLVQPEPISLTYVTDDYFATLRIPLLRGRAFTLRDVAASAPVVIVNDMFVRHYLDGADPARRRIKFSKDGPAVEIIGVVGDIQEEASSFRNYGPMAAVPAAYVPTSQFGDGFGLVHNWFEPNWIIRSSVAVPTIVASMQQAMREIDPQLPFNKFRTMGEVRDDAILVARVQAALLGALGVIALLLCALGIYGLVAHSVSERRRTLSVRLALGATKTQVLKAATAPGLALALSGTAIGLLLAAAAARVMQQLVFGVSVRDPLTFTVGAGVVMMTATVAALVPAIRGLRGSIITTLNSR